MAKFFTNTCPGVAVVTNPFTFVAVGNEFDTHVRVACGKQLPPQYEEVEPEGMRFKQLRILRGSYAKRTPKVREDAPRQTQREHVILVAERDNDKGNAIALLVERHEIEAARGGAAEPRPLQRFPAPVPPRELSEGRIRHLGAVYVERRDLHDVAQRPAGRARDRFDVAERALRLLLDRRASHLERRGVERS